MKKSDALKQKRAEKLQAQKRIVDAAKDAGREFSAEENNDLKALDEEVDSLDEEIATALANEARELRIASLAGAGAGASGEEEQQKIAQRFSFTKAMRQAAEGTLDGVEKEMNDEAMLESKRLGLDFSTSRSFSIPSSMMRATQQTVTGDAGLFGAKLVETQVKPVENFVPKLFLEELGATFLTGLTGNVSLPVADGYEMEWLGEVEAVTLNAAKIDGPLMKPKRAAAGVAISTMLTNQTSVDVEAMVVNQFRNAAKRAIERAAINGDGIKQPLGLLNIPGVQVSSISTATAPDWNSVVELPGLVETANGSDISLGYLMNPKLAALLRTVKKDAGSGRFLMENNQLDAVKTLVSSLVPSLSGNEVLLYGDWSQMYVGQWGGANFVVDPYTRAGSGQIVVYLNIYADVAVALPKAFAVNKFIKID